MHLSGRPRCLTCGLVLATWLAACSDESKTNDAAQEASRDEATSDEVSSFSDESGDDGDSKPSDGKRRDGGSSTDTGDHESEPTVGEDVDGGPGSSQDAAGQNIDAGPDRQTDAAEAQPVVEPSVFGLASVVIDAEGSRTTYVQTIGSLDDGPFDNGNAIEMPGNGVVMAGGGDLFVGLAESPNWIRYSVDEGGQLRESGEMSLLNIGATRIDYGNTYVDERTAVSILTDQLVAVIWDPSTMKIRGEVDMGHLLQAGYDLEVWTTVSFGGRVYVPGRWADWDNGRIREGVSVTIIDPHAGEIVGVAEDERCSSGGRVVFDDDGYAYVMGDGRNYSAQMFANASGQSANPNCLLRIAPGETEFEKDYFFEIPSLTGGLESITELEAAVMDQGLAFAKMFYSERLPDGVEPIDFEFWGEEAHKMWRLELADPPIAREVEGIPFSTIGFPGSAFNGRLYTGESPDGNTSLVYETDPKTNRARKRFEMDGYFNGLHPLASPDK